MVYTFSVVRHKQVIQRSQISHLEVVNKSFVTSKQVTENLWAINSKTNKFTKLPKSDSDTYFSTFILCIGDTTLQLDVSLWLSIFYIFSRGKSYKYTLQKCHLSPFSAEPFIGASLWGDTCDTSFLYPASPLSPIRHQESILHYLP